MLAKGAPGHQELMSSQLKSCDFFSFFYADDPNRSQFCTYYHNRWAVVACAKLWPGIIIMSEVRKTQIFKRFGLWAHKSLVTWVGPCDISFHATKLAFHIISMLLYFWLGHFTFCVFFFLFSFSPFFFFFDPVNHIPICQTSLQHFINRIKTCSSTAFNLTHWPLGDVASNLKVSFSNSSHRIVDWALTVKSISD